MRSPVTNLAYCILIECSPIFSEADKQVMLKKVWRSWTTSEIAELRRMYFEGMPSKEIGRKLDRSSNAVRQRLRICGFSREGVIG